MPTYKGHLIGGIVACAGMFKITTSLWNMPTLSQLPLCLAVCLLGAIFPDIDIESKMQRIFYIVATFFLIGTIFYQQWTLFFIATGLTLLVTQLQHRTLTHNIWFLISIPALLVLYISFKNNAFFSPSLLWYSYFIAGAISHVILDRGVTILKKILGK
ncbi:MAG: metal-dependent hydrolase [bacterium]